MKPVVAVPDNVYTPPRIEEEKPFSTEKTTKVAQEILPTEISGAIIRAELPNNSNAAPVNVTANTSSQTYPKPVGANLSKQTLGLTFKAGTVLAKLVVPELQKYPHHFEFLD